MKKQEVKQRPAGYAYLLDALGLTGFPNWHTSYVISKGTKKTERNDNTIIDFYPVQYWPGESFGDHLEFALKYDGVNLGLLALIFQHLPSDHIVQYIHSKPLGKYSRRIWFFYEFLTGRKLPLDDIKPCNYVNALDTNRYYTVQYGENLQRYRIVNNLLGTTRFCPIVRRTVSLSQLDSIDLHRKCKDIVNNYPPTLLRRALDYLYNKETKSSFQIEHITPGLSRKERFIKALELATIEDFCEKEKLIELQNLIVDNRFGVDDYRTTQNYVGQTISYQKEIIHFISPKPEDLHSLMMGFIDTHKRLKTDNVSPIAHSAVIAYSFVFLHPFEDGNGRIHRFLIHNILSMQGIAPQGIMFPVSAHMLKNPVEYDASLEAFSRCLLPLIDYSLDEVGQMIVHNKTSHWYRFMDLTQQVEALYRFVIKTIEEELVEELDFLAQYDKTKSALRDIIDMPDQLIDLFIKLCLQNNGTLSQKKRVTHFDFLTDKELASMEQIIKEGYKILHKR